MEGLLKELEGKNLSKKKLFDFLLGINLEKLVEQNEEVKIEPVSVAVPVPSDVPILTLSELCNAQTKPKKQIGELKTTEELTCKACTKTFATTSSLKRHHGRFPVCKKWIDTPVKPSTSPLSKGLHLLIAEWLKKSICDTEKYECKYCGTSFITISNQHKHFNTATTCNRLAFEEFKKIINSI